MDDELLRKRMAKLAESLPEFRRRARKCTDFRYDMSQNA